MNAIAAMSAITAMSKLIAISRKTFTLCVLAWAMVWLPIVCAPVLADDIDAYLGNSRERQVYVNVMLDLGDLEHDTPLCEMGIDCAPPYTSNSVFAQLGSMYADGETVTAPGMFRAVLAAVLQEPVFDPLHLALLVPNHHDNTVVGLSGARGGATVLQGYRRLGDSRGQLLATLQGLPSLSGAQSHRLQLSEMLLEWVRYLRGGEVALGMNTRGNFGMDTPQPDYDPSIIDEGVYRSPLAAGECAELYSMVFALDSGDGATALDPLIARELAVDEGLPFASLFARLHDPGATLLPGNPLVAGLSASWLATAAQSKQSLTETADAAAVTGPELVDDPVALERSLRHFLLGLLEGRQMPYLYAFSPATGAAGGIREEVFLGMAATGLSSNWRGNVKKLRLRSRESSGLAAGNPQGLPMWSLVDAKGASALLTAGEHAGWLRDDALTFWTDPGSLPSLGDEAASPVDGAAVALGGAGQKIDGYVAYALGNDEYSQHYVGLANSAPSRQGHGPRQVFMENPAGSGFLPFDVNAQTVARLRELSPDTDSLGDDAILNFIRRARGLDGSGEEDTPGNWLMGALLHSRPLAINYGAVAGHTNENPRILLFFGANDGLFRAVENTSADGRDSGRETFALYPAPTLGAQLRALVTPPPDAYPLYGVDGAPRALVIDRNGDGNLDHSVGDRVLLFFGLRRGGAAYYALDASDPTVPPTLLWKIEAAVDGEFAELAQTFAPPTIGRVNFGGTPEYAVIFPGGYNGGWNATYSARLGKDSGAADDARGNALYIVNALSGELVWKAQRGTTGAESDTVFRHAALRDSFAAEVTPLLDADGVIHRLYMGDTGGAVWRVDLPPNTSGRDGHREASWFIGKLADLGVDAAESGGSDAADRRFFHAVDVVASGDGLGDFDGIVVASGNRTRPGDTRNEDYLFYLKDRYTASGSAAAREAADSNPGRFGFEDVPLNSECEDLDGDDATQSCREQIRRVGWKLPLSQPGEKAVSAPVVDGGRVFFTAYVPALEPSCPPGVGTGRLYALQLRDGEPVAEGPGWYDLGEGMPDAVQRIDDFLFIPGREVELYDLDGDGERDASQFLPSLATRAFSLYWREPAQDPR